MTGIKKIDFFLFPGSKFFLITREALGFIFAATAGPGASCALQRPALRAQLGFVVAEGSLGPWRGPESRPEPRPLGGPGPAGPRRGSCPALRARLGWAAHPKCAHLQLGHRLGPAAAAGVRLPDPPERARRGLGRLGNGLCGATWLEGELAWPGPVQLDQPLRQMPGSCAPARACGPRLRGCASRDGTAPRSAGPQH